MSIVQEDKCFVATPIKQQLGNFTPRDFCFWLKGFLVSMDVRTPPAVIKSRIKDIIVEMDRLDFDIVNSYQSNPLISSEDKVCYKFIVDFKGFLTFSNIDLNSTYQSSEETVIIQLFSSIRDQLKKTIDEFEKIQREASIPDGPIKRDLIFELGLEKG